MRILTLVILLTCLATTAGAREPVVAESAALSVPASGVPGVSERELQAPYWLQRAPDADAVLIAAEDIRRRNQYLLQHDDSMHDLAALPLELEQATVRGWIDALSQRPDSALFNVEGQRIDASLLDSLIDALALDRIPQRQPTRYGLIVRRSALRTFPTRLRVFSAPDDTDIDRFQESALFPGTPVVIAHHSRDRRWLFVLSPRYAAWIDADAVAQGDRETVLGYGKRTPFRIITGDEVRTVFTPEQPALSQLDLDLSVRVPLASNLPADRPVNGQTPYTAWTLQLPLRQTDGSLRFAPALLQKNADSRADYLPLTRANIITQAFKFLGERYGWGHSYAGRDCSGFVSDVYRSMGLLMPRNTSDQGVSPAFPQQRFDKNSSPAKRQKAIAALAVGDLIYIPGHVMMVIGQAHGKHFVIHDVNGIRYRQDDGSLRRIVLNAVSVTPLEPLMFNSTERYIDRMTSIVRPYGNLP